MPAVSNTYRISSCGAPIGPLASTMYTVPGLSTLVAPVTLLLNDDDSFLPIDGHHLKFFTSRILAF